MSVDPNYAADIKLWGIAIIVFGRFLYGVYNTLYPYKPEEEAKAQQNNQQQKPK